VKKRPELSDRPEFARHLHKDTVVTREKLNAFVRDSDAAQLPVLAALRSRAADQETTLVLTLRAATVSVLAVMLARIPLESTGASSDGWAGIVALAIAAVVLATFAILLIMPSVRHAVIGNRNRLRAVVWLAAYEQALTQSAVDPTACPVRSNLRRLVRALTRIHSRRASG